jgi:VanZ family protein
MHKGNARKPVALLLALWGLFIVYATLLPFRFSTSGEQLAASLERVRERPWGSGSRVDAISNVLLFLPWGFLAAVWQAERGAGRLACLCASGLSGAALSASVECAQLFAPGRTTSLLDLLTNTGGAALGGVTGWVFARRLWPPFRRRCRDLVVQRPALACALAVAASLTVVGLSPFAVSVQVDELKSALKRARAIPFGPELMGAVPPPEPWKWGAEVLTWTGTGGVFSLAAREAGRRGGRAITLAVFASGVLSLVIELLQLVIPTRSCDMTSVATAILGAALGAIAVVRSGPGTARRWARPAIVIWATIAVLTHWTPPRFALPRPPFLRPERFVPFWSYYLRTDMGALADLIDQVLLFVPLGVILGVVMRRPSIVRAALVGLAIGLVLEAGQLFLPERTAEITDALSAAAGAGLGLALWRWAAAVRDLAGAHGTMRYRVSDIAR